jgi:hypothetical protein
VSFLGLLFANQLGILPLEKLLSAEIKKAVATSTSKIALIFRDENAASARDCRRDPRR